MLLAFIILKSMFSIPFKLILSFELIVIEFGLYFSIIKLGIEKNLFLKYIVKYINNGDILVNICCVKTKI